jgi:DNA-binding response OmpR family regulator
MTRRVVLIEDDPDIAALVEAMLTEVGHEVEVVEHLTEGLIDPDAPLVITDLLALRSFDPEMARAWIARVRGAFPNAAVIVSTAHGTAAAVGAPAIGADAVLVKPFDIAVFTETVESLLGA